MLMTQDAPATAASTLSGDLFGRLINLAGRRRFTSQRLVLHAVLASLQHDGALETAREALVQFREAHLLLVEERSGMPGIFCEQLRLAHFGSLQGERKIRDFMDLAGRTIDALDKGTVAAPVLLDELVRSATPLLAALNALTLVYEEQSQRHARQLRRELHAMMGDIKSIAKQARMVAFNAQIVAARSGAPGREFAVVASTLTNITGEIDQLVEEAMSGSMAA